MTGAVEKVGRKSFIRNNRIGLLKLRNSRRRRVKRCDLVVARMNRQNRKQSRQLTRGGNPSILRVLASSCQDSPRAVNRSFRYASA